MEQSVKLEIPRQWLAGVPDEPITLQQIFRLGLYQYRVTRALALYQDGVGSLGYIAEQLKLPKRDLMREARLRGIEPEFSDESIDEDLA
jgi:predicted HTH domain antitoxin